MSPQTTRDRRRAATVAGTATALGVSLIGGALVLGLAGPPVKKPAALETLTPPPPSSTPSSELDTGSSGDLLSMFGGDSVGSISAADAGTTAADLGGDPLALSPGAAGALPELPALTVPPGQVPTLPTLPAAPAFDWNAALAPLAQAQANSQAAGVTGSVLGSASGLAGAAISSTGVVIGDLILYAALSDNGGPVLNQLQASLASVPTAAAALPAVSGFDGLQFPSPDLSGLNAAFAAAAAAPPLGMPQLPPAPAGLPTPEQALGALAAGAAALPALPPPPQLPPMPDLSALLAVPAIGVPQLPGPPELPQLPRPEDVVGGVVGGLVAATIAGAVLGAVFQPPSLTRLMGLPF